MRFGQKITTALTLVGVTALQALQAFPSTAEPNGPNRRWARHSATLSISSSLFSSTSISYGADVRETIRQSADAWQRVADFNFVFATSDAQNISSSRSGGDGISLITIAATSENVQLFPNGGDSPPALTRLFFDRKGAISEADILLNPYVRFSTDGSADSFDLQTVLTHEIGHLVGLDHSLLPSSTMNPEISKNEIGHISDFGRSLSSADVASIRSIYGGDIDNTDCCGEIAGSIPLSSATGSPWLIWAEDPETGAVKAQVLSNKTGGFELGGLSEGKYQIFSQGTKPGSADLFDFGIVSVERGGSIFLGSPTRVAIASFDGLLMGLNARLSRSPVLLQPGGSYQLFIGGLDFYQGAVTFGSSSPFLEFSESSTVPIDYGNRITARTVNIKVSKEIPRGEYSLFLPTVDRKRRYFVGAIIVE